MDIFKDAVEDSTAKLTKSFEKILFEVIILFMVIPRKINFTQMGRYGSHVEQTYRNVFGLKKSKCIDWLKLNVSLAKRYYGEQGRWAIAIDPSYISKAGKKTPHIGRFWSGCVQSVKTGLEIMGIGLIDIDAKNCMMLRAHQSLSNKELSLRNKSMVDFYISVIKRYRKELLKLSTLIVADAYFSTSTFAGGIKKEGFSLISRFRDNACLFYVYDGPRTGKRGRPKTKDGKIDMKNLDLTRMEKMDVKDIDGTAYTLIAYSKALKCKVRLVIWQMPNGKKKMFFSTDTSLSRGTPLLQNQVPNRILLSRRKRLYRSYGLPGSQQVETLFCFQCIVHIAKCCQGNYEGDGNGIFNVFIQVTDDQHLFGETNFLKHVGTTRTEL